MVLKIFAPSMRSVHKIAVGSVEERIGNIKKREKGGRNNIQGGSPDGKTKHF